MIRVLLCKHKGFAPLSWLIRKIEETEYSHFAFEEGGLVTDATGKGIRSRPESEFLKDYDIVEVIYLRYSNKSGQDWATKHRDKKYGYGQLLGIWWGVNWFRNGTKQMICTETVLRLINYLFRASIVGIDTMGLKEARENVLRYKA